MKTLEIEEAPDLHERNGAEPAADAEPEYRDVGELVPCKHPTRDAEAVIRVVSHRVKLGRSRFGRQVMQMVADGPVANGKKKPADTLAAEMDLAGLFAYDVDRAVTSFRYVRRDGREVRNTPGTPISQRLEDCPDWFGEWLSEQISHVNGWDKKQEEATAAFPGELAEDRS